MSNRAEHWAAVYEARAPDEVSWYQPRPATSLRLISAVASAGASVVDVGAGASTLVDALLDAGWVDLSVLDVSSRSLETVRARLGDRAAHVDFIAADLLEWQPERRYDVWHDRAVFHFLTDDAERSRYVSLAGEGVAPGGALVLGTFAPDGPTHCSGLPTARYGAEELAELFANRFDLLDQEREEHTTPSGARQSFTWVVLRRRAGDDAGATR